MKMPKFLKIAIIFLVLNLLFITNVQSAASSNSDLQWTDFSNARVYLDRIDLVGESSDFKRYNLKIDNVSFDTDNKTLYFVYLSNSNDKPDFGSSFTELRDNSTVLWDCNSEKEIDAYTISPFIDRIGDIHVWIVEAKLAEDYYYEEGEDFYEEDQEYTEIECEFKEVLSNAVITFKPSLNSLGKRISLSFEIYRHSERTSIASNEPIDTNRQISIEIGKVTDYNLLYEIKNNEPNNLEHLIDYKDSATPVYKKTTNVAEGLNILSEVELEDEAYYYTYVNLLDEDGKYRSIEDISLHKSADVQPQYFNDYVTREDPRFLDYESPNFVWKLPPRPVQPTPDEDSGTGSEKDPSTAPGQSPSTSPEKDPSTAPEQSPGTSTDKDPSTSPEQTPGSSTEKDPSIAPEQTPGSSTDKDPSTTPDQNSQPGSNSDSQHSSGSGSNNQSNDELDNTVMQGNLPQTGETPSALSLIILAAIVGIVSYTCYIKYKDKV